MGHTKQDTSYVMSHLLPFFILIHTNTQMNDKLIPPGPLSLEFQMNIFSFLFYINTWISNRCLMPKIELLISLPSEVATSITNLAFSKYEDNAPIQALELQCAGEEWQGLWRQMGSDLCSLIPL